MELGQMLLSQRRLLLRGLLLLRLLLTDLLEGCMGVCSLSGVDGLGY